MYMSWDKKFNLNTAEYSLQIKISVKINGN